MAKTHYSCAELAAMKLPGMPASRQNIHALVKREGWENIEQKGNGGPGGVIRLYAPPERIAKLIAAHQVGANVTVRAGDSKQYVITLDMTVSETADMLRWLEKRRARHG